MKMILIILVIITTILFQGVSEEIKLPPEKMPEWWSQKTDEEQYQTFRELAKEYVKINNILDEKMRLIEILKYRLETTTDFLQKYKPFKPRFGIHTALITGYYGDFKMELMQNLNFLIFFAKSRLFMSLGGYIKFYDTTKGGGVIGLGFIF